MKWMIYLIYLFLLIFGVSFSLLNADKVTLNLYLASFTLPLSLLLVLVLVFGVCLGIGLIIFKYWRLKYQYRKLSNQLQLKEQEIQNLRVIPIKDSSI
jgi:putative membrane protein